MPVVECYHQPLRRAFAIIKHDALDTPDTDALHMAVKLVNDSIGAHGLIPTLLAYGSLSRLGFPKDPSQPSMYKRASAVRKATKEISKIYAQRQVTAAIKSQHHPNVQPIHETCIGQPVLVNSTTLQAWNRQFRLLEVSGEFSRVQLPRGKATFCTTHVKPYNINELQFDST